MTRLQNEARKALRYYPIMTLLVAVYMPYELPRWMVIAFLVIILISGLCTFTMLFDPNALPPITITRPPRRSRQSRIVRFHKPAYKWYAYWRNVKRGRS